MKKMFFVLFLSGMINHNLFSQDYNLDFKPKSEFKYLYLPIILFTTSIAFNAIGDALDDEKNLMAGHIFNSLSIATLLSVPLFCEINKKKWYIYPLSYMFLRIGLFDPLYNKVRGLNLNYVGNESYSDKFWQKFGTDMFTRTFSFGVGIALPLSVFKSGRNY